MKNDSFFPLLLSRRCKAVSHSEELLSVVTDHTGSGFMTSSPLSPTDAFITSESVKAAEANASH